MGRPMEKQNVSVLPSPCCSGCGQIVKLGAGSCSCSGLTLTPSDELWSSCELWPILEAPMLTSWARGCCAKGC